MTPRPAHSPVLAVALGLMVLSACGAPASGRAQAVSAPTASVSGHRAAATQAPARPRRTGTRTCGWRGLDGPATRPRGARRVRPSQDLPAMVDAAAPGTTFWLQSGVHHLGKGLYDQVTPKDSMTFVGAPGAVIDGQRLNAYAFTGRARGVTIRNLTIRNFGRPGGNHNEGVVNHDAGTGWHILRNTIRRNAGAGVFVGSHNVVARNCLRKNGQYGFSAYAPGGVRGVTLRRNEIAGNNTDDWESRVEDCGCSGGGKFWETRNARVVGNWIHHNNGVGLWADTNNTGFLVKGNRIAGNDSEGLIYETSYNAAIVDNVFVRNALRDGPRDPGFPMAALYISESGSDPRAGSRFGTTFLVEGNRFVDNWSGIIAWENADRFAGSPANSSTGATTLVNPGVATEEACSDPDLVAVAPYVDDCRWKTQNLRVQHNTFRFRPARIGPSCRSERGCGYVGLMSQWGSYPDWSPYLGTTVEEAITFEQGNRWRENRYVGPWRFQVKELWNVVGWAQWRRAPYRQDRGSTLVRS